MPRERLLSRWLSTHRRDRLVLSLLIASTVGCESNRPVGEPVVEFATAEKCLPLAIPGLLGNTDGMHFRCSPDGRQVAWLAVGDGQPIASTSDRRLELRVTAADGTSPRTTLLHKAAEWPDYSSRGPVWLPDSSGVLVGYNTKEADTNQTTAYVDLVHGGAATKPLVRMVDARVCSLAVARDTATIAVLLQETFPTTTKGETFLLLCDREGQPQGKVPLSSLGVWQIAASPDSRCFAVASPRSLLVVPASGGDPRPVCDIRYDADIVESPQWLDDGKALVVAAGGGVVHAHRENGLLHAWTEADLGGRAHAVVVLPGDKVAATIVMREKDGNVLQLLLGAGHAPQRTFADLVWLNLDDGGLRRSKVTVEVVDRGRLSLPYLRGLTELLAKFLR